jgi:hypothetical protein
MRGIDESVFCVPGGELRGMLHLPPVQSSDVVCRIGNVVEDERRDSTKHDSESGLRKLENELENRI